MLAANKLEELPESHSNIGAIIKKEIQFFKDEGIRGKYLSLPFETLKSVCPTSVDSERAFSTAGLFFVQK